MENFNDTLRQLNESESKYTHLHQQYTELKSIVSQINNDVPNILQPEQNVDKTTTAATDPSNRTPKAAVKSDPSSSNKKAAKTRIKHYHTIISNMEKFRSDDRGKAKFIENLKKNNEISLQGQSLNPVLRGFFAGERES